jgi:glycosyltransferase involved in cell wall biosynthesis
MEADENALVSVVIPAYNAAVYIREALAGASAQSHRNLEIIVVDDGSSDETAEIVREIAAQDGRVRLIQTPNGGVARARNHGIREARGEFIAILDADDIWHRDKILKQIEIFCQSSAALGVVYCWYREIDDQGRVLSNIAHPPYRGDVYAALLLSNFVGGGSTALIRRVCLEEVGGFDPSLRDRRAQGSEDTKLFLAIAENYDFDLVPEFLMGYRRPIGSMSRDVSQMLRSITLVLSEARLRHPELPRWLFRWAYGEATLWLASESLYSGRVGLGLLLMLRTLLWDPVAVCRCNTFNALMTGIGYTARSVSASSWMRWVLRYLPHRVPRSLQPDARRTGPLFLSVAPDWGIATTRKTRRARRLSFARRQATVASWNISRPLA